MSKNNLLTLVCGIVLGIGISCTSSSMQPSSRQEDFSALPDTIQKRKIDSLVTINTRSLDTVYRKRIPYHVYAPTDSIDYWFAANQMGRIAMNLHPDSNQVWPYFWIYNGELVRVRVRKFDTKANPPYSQETMVYLKDGNPVYCEDRRKDLVGGEMPGAVMREKYTPCTRVYSEIEKDFAPYWKIALAELKKHNVLPTWVKE